MANDSIRACASDYGARTFLASWFGRVLGGGAAGGWQVPRLPETGAEPEKFRWYALDD
jgi:hypothetical protein